MLKEVTFPTHRRFRSRTEWEPIGFFSDCLCNSTQFDLMLGFFSSSAINVLADGFASFLYNGGRMNLIVNDILTEQDKVAITNGSLDTPIPFFNIDDIENLKNTLSERDAHFFDCLAWLIRNNRLDIKIVAPKDGIGISHTKTGVFSDGVNKVGFDGSCNFSRSALIDNIESLTVSCDWDGNTATATINEIKSEFERVFSGQDESIGYQGNIWGLSFNYERVAPNYSTLGGYYFTNDIENFTFAPNVKLLDGKINLSGNVGFQYTNLDGTKTTDTRNNVYSANASFNSGEHWTASLSFSNFNTYTKVKPQAYPYYADALDSLNFYQVSRSASAMTSYNWGGDALKNAVSLSGSYQTANMLSEKKLTSYSDYFSGNVSFSQQVTALKMGWSSYMMASYCDATNAETLYWGPGASVSKQFFEDKLSTGLSATYNVNDVSGMTKGSLLNTSLNASYSIQPKKKQLGSHTFSFSTGYTKYIGGMASGDNQYEFLSCLTYRCGF